MTDHDFRSHAEDADAVIDGALSLEAVSRQWMTPARRRQQWEAERAARLAEGARVSVGPNSFRVPGPTPASSTPSASDPAQIAASMTLDQRDALRDAINRADYAELGLLEDDAA